MAGMAGIATASVGLATVTNKGTAEQAAMAASVGASYDTMVALGQSIAEIGMNFENGIDLVEELNNKFGEMKELGEFTAVEESLSALNMKFEDLKNLAPEEQFQAIMDKAAMLEDAQKAAFAVDSLMGGEANKVLGHLRAEGVTLTQTINQAKRLNFNTDKAVAGAKAHTKAMAAFEKIMGSITKLFSGELGESLALIIENMNEWILLNKEILRQNIEEAARAIGGALRSVASVLKFFLGIFAKVVRALGGARAVFGLVRAAVMAIIGTTAVLWFLKLATAIKSAGGMMALLNASFLANPIFLAIAAITALILVVEDLWMWIDGNTAGTIFGAMLGDFETFKAKAVAFFKELPDLITKTIAGWAVAVSAMVATAVEKMQELWANFDFAAVTTGWLEAIHAWLIRVTMAIITAFKNIGAQIATIIADALPDPGEYWSSFKSKAGAAFDGIKEFVGFGPDTEQKPAAAAAGTPVQNLNTMTQPNNIFMTDPAAMLGNPMGMVENTDNDNRTLTQNIQVHVADTGISPATIKSAVKSGASQIDFMNAGTGVR